VTKGIQIFGLLDAERALAAGKGAAYTERAGDPEGGTT